MFIYCSLIPPDQSEFFKAEKGSETSDSGGPAGPCETKKCFSARQRYVLELQYS